MTTNSLTDWEGQQRTGLRHCSTKHRDKWAMEKPLKLSVEEVSTKLRHHHSWDSVNPNANKQASSNCPD